MMHIHMYVLYVGLLRIQGGYTYTYVHAHILLDIISILLKHIQINKS